MQIKLFVILFLFCQFPVWANAEEIVLRDVVSALEAPFKARVPDASKATDNRIADFQAHFIQESRIASVDRVQHGEGEVSFKFLPNPKGDDSRAMFRWLYSRPTRQEIVSNGSTLWVYVPENRQVILSDIRQFNQLSEENPVTFLGGLGNLSRDFKIDWDEPKTDPEGNFLLILRPRKDSQFIATAGICVVRKAVMSFVEQQRSGDIFPIQATKITDPNGNQTAIEFREIRINRQLSEESFNFSPPADVEVVRPTGEQVLD